MAAENTGDSGNLVTSDSTPKDQEQSSSVSDEALSQELAQKELALPSEQRHPEFLGDKARAAYDRLLAESQKSVLARTGDKGDSALTVTAKKEEPKPQEAAVSLSPPPAERPPETAGQQIFGRTTIFHYNHDGSRDKEDPGSTGFFGTNLDDPSLVGAAVPVDILEAQFGKFTQRLPDGTYAALDTPEAREIIQRIKSSHVLVSAPDGRQVEVPIVDIQGSYKNWHRTLDLTLGAWKALGLSDDTYLGYSIVAGDGTVMNADGKWSDTSPMAKLYQSHGKEFANTYPSEVLKAAKASIAPDMPDEDYERAMRDPNGKEELAKYKARPKSPGEQLASIEGTPYYGLDKDTLTKKVFSDLVREKKIDPAKTNLSEIGDKLFPNPSVVESLGELFNWDSSFWSAAKRAGSSETHQMSAQAYDFPKNLEEFGKLFSNPVTQKIDQWLDKNTPLEGYWSNFVAYMHGLSQQQANQAKVDAQRQAQAATTVPGKVGAVVGGAAAGTTLSLASTLVPGAPIKSAVALASLYEGISRYGEAAQKGQSDALIQGIEGAGMGGLSRYMMDAPNGRAMTAGITWLANTGEDTLSRMLKGEHTDATDIVTRSAVDLTTGWLMGKAKEAPRTGLAGEVTQAPIERARLREQVLGPEVSEELPWYAPGPVVTRPSFRETFSPQELSLAVGQLPSGASPSELARRAGLLAPSAEVGPREVHLADPESGLKQERATILRAEAKAMQIAKENGDHNGALEHGNRALAMLNGEEQKEMARDQITLSAKWADNTVTPGTEPTIKLNDTERLMVSHFAGLGSVEVLEDRPLDLDSTIKEHLDVDGVEKNGEAKVAEQEKTQTQAVSDELEATEPPAPVAEFHAGIPVAPAVRGMRSAIKALGRTDPVMAMREKMGGLSPEMTGIIRARRSEAEERIVRVPIDVAHSMRVDKVLRGGEKTAVRRDFFSKFAKPTQLAMMIAHEKKQPVGHPVAQELFKIHDAVYKAIEAIEKKAGFKYDAREVYIYHLIKGGKEERVRFERYYNALVAANPRFVHQRFFGTLEALHKAGFRLETYNPEELMQRRLFQSQMAITKVMELRDAERAGMAYRVDHPGLSAGIKAWGEPIRAPNGERYYVRPDAQVPLRNAWDLTSLYSDRVWGRPLKVLAALKGAAVPLKLGFSFVHGKHIIKMSLANAFSSLTRSGLRGQWRGQMLARELERLGKLGWAHSAEVSYLQGKRVGKGLSLEQQTNIKHFEWAGLSARISDETRLSFNHWMDQLLSDQMDRLQVPRGTREKVHGAATLLQHGYDLVSSKVVQEPMFNTFIPQIKFSQFLTLRDQLLREHPELLQDKNEFRLKEQLARIGESVEARFGEMFHDNLLWKKTWKDIGTASLLSFGWNLGAIRIYAGAIRDTAALGAKMLEDRRISRDDLTDRMLFAGWYTALNALESGLITYTSVSLWNAAHPAQKQNPIPDGLDYVFPRIGYDSSGKAKRVSPVEYSREIPTWWQHVQDQGLVPGTMEMIRNKLSPVMNTLIEDFQNRNFYGQSIYDPNDPWHKQVQDAVGYTLDNFFHPISFAAAPSPLGQKTGRERSWTDAAWAAIGFPPAAAWTGRTGIENRIVDTFYAHNPQWQKSPENIERSKHYEELRRAVQEKNPAAERVAEKALTKLKVPKSSISYVRNHPNETYEQHLFKSFPASEQLKLLKGMNPDELRQYWPLAHKDLRAKYHNEAGAAVRAAQ